MSLNREKLRQITVDSAPRLSGMEAIVESLHRAPASRERVTLETFALPPVPVKREDGWSLVSLLVVPAHAPSADLIETFLPKAFVEWSWPDGELKRLLELRDDEATAELSSAQQPIANTPSDQKATAQPLECARRLKALYRILEASLTSPPDNENLPALAGHYAGLLPHAAYPFYWALCPGSRSWLHPDVPAPVLETSAEIISTNGRDAKSSVKETRAALKEIDEVKDLSEQVGGWMRRALSLAKESDLPEVSRQLQALEERRQAPGFYVAVVGEFSRGKSTLVNRLLGRKLLPVGLLPTTATLVSIAYGKAEGLDVTFPDNRKERRPLNESAWSDLLTDNYAQTETNGLRTVRATIEHQWLHDCDIELIDTPGANDINARRAVLVSDLLNQCDAAVLVVSALNPLSLTETAFLEQEVIARHVPRVLIVVSHFDMLDAGERASVLELIRQRAHEISPNIPVLPSSSVRVTESDDEALAKVRQHIASQSAKAERRVWRSRQIAGQLSTLLASLREYAENRIAAERLDATERAAALQAAKNQLRKAGDRWEAIRTDLEQRRIHCEKDLRQRLLQAGEELSETLRFELSRTPDPKSWYERDLPFRMRRELATFSRRSEDLLLGTLARDLEWLRSTTAQNFQANMARKIESPSAPAPALRADFLELELADTHRLRFFSRVGSGTASIVGYLLLGPIAMASAVGIGLMSEPLINKRIEEQRSTIERSLLSGVEAVIDEYYQRISERLRRLYGQVLDQARQEQSLWHAAQISALEAKHRNVNGDMGQKGWEILKTNTDALTSEILTALSSQPARAFIGKE